MKIDVSKDDARNSNWLIIIVIQAASLCDVDITKNNELKGRILIIKLINDAV